MTNFVITHIEVANSALKRVPENGRELARREFRSLAEGIIFKNRQNELFPIDSKYCCSSVPALTVLSATASWCREWGIILSGTTATINHYLELDKLKGYMKKKSELEKNTEFFSFTYSPNL